MASDPVQPATINSIVGSIDKAYALLAGLQLDLFTALQGGPRTAEELADAVRGDVPRLASLLYFLVRAGLLTTANGRFANTPEADRYLVRGRSGSWVDRAALMAQLWSSHAKTADSIRAGRALAAHEFSMMSREELVTVLRGLDAPARVKGTWLADAFDFATCRTLLDVGGGSGALAIAVTERHPHVRATVADLPSVVAITDEFIASAGAAGRVGTLGIDVVKAAIPPAYDVAVLCRVIQVVGPEEACAILRRVGEALSPGGTLYIIGAIVDNTHLAPSGAVSFNFNAISFYERGQAYTESEYRAWLAEADFVEVEFIWSPPPVVDGVVVVAHKP